MTFICHQEQTFKGKINNVEITDQNQYCATIRVLRKIERIYAIHDDEFQGDIYFPDAFSQLPCPSFYLEDMACCILNLVRTFSNS